MHSFHGGHGHGYGYDMDIAMDMTKVLHPSNDLDIHDRNFVIWDMDCRLPSQIPTLELPYGGQFWGWAILSTSVIRIAHLNYKVLLCNVCAVYCFHVSANQLDCFAINVLYFSPLIVCHTHLFVFGTQLRHSMHLFEAECVVFWTHTKFEGQADQHKNNYLWKFN